MPSNVDFHKRSRHLADVGVDEMILWLTVATLDQIDRLAEITAQNK